MGWSYDKDYDYNNITIIWYQRDFTNKVVTRQIRNHFILIFYYKSIIMSFNTYLLNLNLSFSNKYKKS